MCSRCAGLHRELNHKVKGISMSVFNDKETEFVRKWGNENAAKVWLHGLKKSGFAEPTGKDTYKLKEFMRAVYEQKRFYQKEESSSEGESESEDEKEEPKKVSNKKKDSASKPVPAVKFKAMR